MKVSTSGIPILDEALKGGMPKGSTILLWGLPGSGADLFAKQFASAGVSHEEVVYFTTTEMDEDIISTMEEFGWKKDIRIVNIGGEYYESVLAKELEVSRYRKEGITLKDIKKPKEARRTDTNLLTTLTYEISKLKPPFRLVVDSLDFFFEYYEHSRVLSAIRTIKAHAQRTESIALLTLRTGVYEMKIKSGVEEIVDLIIELERKREKQEFKRSLIIRKVRNHPERTGVFPFEISKNGMGIK